MEVINVFRPTREETIGEQRKLHYGDVSDLFYSTNIIWVIITRRVRYVAFVGEKWNCVQGLILQAFSKTS